MKIHNFVIVACFSVLGHIIVNYENQIKTLQMTSDILRDQIEDYANQISEMRSAKTYEQGLADGFNDKQNIDYIRGYHAATKDNNPFMVITENVNVED